MMKSLTLRSLTIASLLSSALFASSIDDKVLKYEKNRISSDKRIKLKDLKLNFKKDLKIDGWVGYVYDVSLNINGKDMAIKDTIFSNGKMITAELKNLRNNMSYKRLMYPTLSYKYYDDSYLIAGNKNAKHKITIFSDPLCPNCIDVMPEIIADVQKNPNKLALYYIHMPLDMHPTARLLTKAATIAKKLGVKNVDYKLYTAEFENSFDAYAEKDEKKVLAIFNKKFKTNITMKQINNRKLNEELEHHLKLSDDALIQGTPTVFFDGEIDPMRNKYTKYIK